VSEGIGVEVHQAEHHDGSVRNVWPAPAASSFSVSDLISLRQRIRSQDTVLAKMEVRAPS
jgi:hypothetical protein